MDSNLPDCSPLHLLAGSVSSYSYTMAELFLAKGYNPNIQNSEGLTPVHVAAVWGQYEMLKLLLLNGGDLEIKDGEGKTPRDLAVEEKKQCCIELIDWWTNFDSPCPTPTKSSQYTPKFFTSPIRELGQVQKTADDTISDDVSVVSEDFTNKLRFAQYSNGRSTNDAKTSTDDIHTCTPDYKKTPPSVASPSKTNKRFARQLLIDSCCSPCTPDDPSPPYASNGVNINTQTEITLPALCQKLNDTIRQQEGESNENFMSALEETVIEVEKERENELDQDILKECRKLSDVTLRKKLLEFGADVGPINQSTRWLYIRKLVKLLSEDKTIVNEDKSVANYPKSLRAAFEGNWDEIESRRDESEMIESFENEDRNWREGRQRMSFCYLLLDPRIANKITDENINLSENEKFREFVKSIFYIGKGKKARPFEHLIAAAKIQQNCPTQACEKTKKIMELWSSGVGVLSLPVFQNIMAVEAYSREAAMIDTIGRNNISNVRKGLYYGLASTWNSWRRERFGIYLLHRAMAAFLVDGRRPLFPKDVI